MHVINEGKTKTLIAESEGRVRVFFKDDVTGGEDGIDPGGNVVVGRIDGKGLSVLKQSVYFFTLLEEHGIRTHFIEADFDRSSMIAYAAKTYPMEFIVRFEAHGSFIRRYGKFVKEGTPLGGLVEMTLKDDDRDDPLINDEACIAIRMIDAQHLHEAKQIVRKAAHVIRDHFEEHGIDLLDMKFECGIVDGNLVIIDDISTDNMRLVRGGKSLSADDVVAVLQL